MIDFSQISKGDESKSFKEDNSKQPSSDNVDFSSLNIKEPSEERKIDFSHIKKDEPQEEGLAKNKRYLQAQELYKKGLSLAEEVTASSLDSFNIEINQVVKLIESFLDFIKEDDQELISFIFPRSSYQAHYLALNMLNVSILCLEVGLWLGLSREELIKLGVSSFLHDVGMIPYLEVVSQPKRLSLSEFEKIKRHPQQGKEFFKRIGSNIDDSILEAVEQEHERMDGSGYPHRLKKEEISQFAQIIGFVDVYEALICKRPYRPSYTSQEAIKIILSNRNSFSNKIAKAFLEKVGLYPKGTIVELNTKEIAFVIRHNPKAPTSPKVQVLFDSQGRRIEKIKQIDLSKSPTLYIVKSM